MPYDFLVPVILVIPVILVVSGNQTAQESLADQETGKTPQVRIEPAICPVSQILVTARCVVSAVFRWPCGLDLHPGEQNYQHRSV